jgi:hypothetical protein
MFQPLRDTFFPSTADAGYENRSRFFVGYLFSDSILRGSYSEITKLSSGISKFAILVREERYPVVDKRRAAVK